MKYVASSLEDVAKFFDMQAEREMKLLSGAKPQAAKIIKGRATTWMLAADLIRNTEIRSETKIAELKSVS